MNRHISATSKLRRSQPDRKETGRSTDAPSRRPCLVTLLSNPPCVIRPSLQYPVLTPTRTCSGMEVGYYAGCVGAWRRLQQLDATAVPARAERGIIAMEELLAGFPLNDPQVCLWMGLAPAHCAGWSLKSVVVGMSVCLHIANQRWAWRRHCDATDQQASYTDCPTSARICDSIDLQCTRPNCCCTSAVLQVKRV